MHKYNIIILFLIVSILNPVYGGQFDEISNSIKSVCHAPSDGTSTHYKIIAKGHSAFRVKFLGKLGGEAEFNKEEWNGIQRVLRKDLANDRDSYRQCVRDLTPIFIEKFIVSDGKGSISKNNIGNYIIDNNGTSLDKKSNLLWMRCSIGQYFSDNKCTGKVGKFNWEEAKNIFIEYAGYNDWRIPNTEELGSLVECGNEIKNKEALFKYTCAGETNKMVHKKPTINSVVFPNTYQNDYWTSDNYDDKGLINVVNFRGGYYIIRHISAKLPVRLVRSVSPTE